MNTFSARKLAITYVGVFLGAGFVSGQELWQFFACFGPAGFAGFLFSSAIFFTINYILLDLVRATDDQRLSHLLTRGNHPWVKALVDILQYLFLFGIVVIMIAGATSLIRQFIPLPAPVAGAAFSLLVLLVSLLGLQGLVATFSLLVPVTTALAVILGLAVSAASDFHFSPAAGSVSPLLPTWWAGSLTYAAYNLFGTVGILIPFAPLLPDRKTLRRGLGWGTGLLALLAEAILSALMVRPDAGSADLPMAALASQLHPALGVAYGLLMGLGMFAAALGSLVALINQMTLRWPTLGSKKTAALSTLVMGAFLLSLMGFVGLIGVVYPLFGYVSIPLFFCLLLNWRQARCQTPVLENNSPS